MCYAMAEHNVESFREFERSQSLRQYCLITPVKPGESSLCELERLKVGYRELEIYSAALEYDEEAREFMYSGSDLETSNPVSSEIKSIAARLNTLSKYFENPEIREVRALQFGAVWWKAIQQHYAKHPAFYFEYPFEPAAAGYVSEYEPMREFKNRALEDTGFLYLERPQPKFDKDAFTPSILTEFVVPAMPMSPEFSKRQRNLENMAFKKGPWQDHKTVFHLSIGCTVPHHYANYLAARELAEQVAAFVPDWHAFVGRRTVSLDIEIKNSSQEHFSDWKVLHTGTHIFLLLFVPYREDRNDLLEAVGYGLKQSLMGLKQCVSESFKRRNKIEIEPVLRYIDELVAKSRV